MPMPKFAANLGMTPLEPVKSDILTPTQAPITPTIPSSDRSSSQATTSSVSQASQQNGDIPAAQFDWSASGLANPLDCKYSLSCLMLFWELCYWSVEDYTCCVIIKFVHTLMSFLMC